MPFISIISVAGILRCGPPSGAISAALFIPMAELPRPTNPLNECEEGGLELGWLPPWLPAPPCLAPLPSSWACRKVLREGNVRCRNMIMRRGRDLNIHQGKSLLEFPGSLHYPLDPLRTLVVHTASAHWFTELLRSGKMVQIVGQGQNPGCILWKYHPLTRAVA